jgi:N-acetyl-D-muramate 6-phosphate phosphatase
MADAQPRPLPIRAVLFDLDGTLVDSAPDLAAALNRLRADRGLAALPLAHLRPYVSQGARGMLAAGLDITESHGEYAALRDIFLAHYERDVCRASVLFEGISEVLAAIGARGLRWGVVTNKARRFTEPLLVALDLWRPAACVVCGDSTAKSKPHPEPLLFAARQLALAPAQCVYVGDAARDIESAQAANMLSLVAEYGYIPAHERPRDWPATGWLVAPRDLLGWLPDQA